MLIHPSQHTSSGSLPLRDLALPPPFPRSCRHLDGNSPRDILQHLHQPDRAGIDRLALLYRLRRSVDHHDHHSMVLLPRDTWT
jgi:hypothetical protein